MSGSIRRRLMSISRWTKSITIHFKLGKIDCEANVDVDMYSDDSYGEDTDGNRGEPQQGIEGFRVEDATDDKGNGVEVNEIVREIIKYALEDIDLRHTEGEEYDG